MLNARPVPGLHHVTAVASDPKRNLAFYREVLGLRLVKKTVNFDDPGTYHFYFGDEAGSPGSILTFFPWQQIGAGRLGRGETGETAFRIPEGSLGFWLSRFVERGVPHDQPERRFGRSVIGFRDPDGLRLALVAGPDADAPVATHFGIDAEVAIRGLDSVTLWVAETAPTGAVLEALGYHREAVDGALTRYVATAAVGGTIDLREVGNFPAGQLGGGSVHHIAFRVADDAVQAELAGRLRALGLALTPQQDRNYFRSVYFREPGGVLFELATDGPGFAVDEAPASLGDALKLPARYERHRAEIEAVLPALT